MTASDWHKLSVLLRERADNKDLDLDKRIMFIEFAIVALDMSHHKLHEERLAS